MRLRSLLPILLLVLALLPARNARACAACACGDPIASRMGLPDSASGNAVIAGIAVETARNRYDFETQDDTSLAVVAGWTGTRTRLLVRMPYVRREMWFLGVSRRNEGTGDAEVTGTFELTHSGNVVAGHASALSLTAGIPTGRYEHGEMEALQSGSGAPSVAFGGSWFAHRKADRLYVSIAHRMSFDRPSGYRAGDVELVNAGWQRPVPFSRMLDFTMELNARRAAADRWSGGLAVKDSGGDVLYAAPGLVAIAGAHDEWFVRASAQIPIAHRTRGDQQPGPVFQAGLFRSF